MKKMPRLLDLVVMNHESDATLYRVVEECRNYYQVGLIDATIEDAQPNQKIQWVDLSLVEPPTNGQLSGFLSARFAR